MAAPNLPGVLEYPQLTQIADGDRAAAVLREHMGPPFASGDLDLGPVAVVRAYYRPKPGRDYRIQLRAGVVDRRGAQIGEQIFCGQIWPESELEGRALEARRRPLAPPDFGQPVVVVRPWNMILWAFPNDPELPQLSELAQPDAVLARARARPDHFGLPTGAVAQGVDVALVKYVPARRCAFAYVFDLGPGEGAHRVYAKAYRGREARRAWWRQRAIWEAGSRSSAALRIAEPHAYDENLEAIFQEALPGRPLTHWLGDARLPELAGRAGTALAALHATPAHLPLRRALSAERRELSTKGDAILRAFPQHAARCGALRTRLLDSAEVLGAGRQRVVHGAFRMSHVLSDGHEIAFIDLDGACLGDPAHDLGRFAAQLVEARVAGRVDEASAGSALRELVAAYHAASDEPVPEERIRWFTASQLVTGHLYKSVKRAESPHLEATLRAAEELAPPAHARSASAAPRVGSAIPHDPALTDLDLLVDAGRMRVLFQERLGVEASGLRVESAQLEKVNYRVNRYCGALYRLGLRSGSGAPRDQWFYVRHGEAKETRRRFESAARPARTEAQGWSNLAHWADRHMMVWAFPHDPRLSKLPEVIDPSRVRAEVESRREVFGLAPGESVEEVRWHPVKHMPGKRTILRFEIALRGRDPDDGLSFFSKSYRDARSERVYRALESTRSALAANGAQLEIPRALLHLEDLHTYWQSPWHGESMSGLHGTPRLALALPLVARSLGELHSTPAELAPASYVAETAAGAARDAEKIAGYWPSAGPGAQSIARRIARLESRLPGPERFPQATIHGAFRMSQLLRCDERLALLDYDALAAGDPHYDVAELQASLLHRAFLRGLDLVQVRKLAEAFRQHYESDVSWPLDDTRLAWFEGAFLLEKLYLALKNLEMRLFPRIEEFLDFVNGSLDRVEHP